jgi:hypothetical protein
MSWEGHWHDLMATTDTTKTTNDTAPRAGLLINRNYALLWGSQAISIMGDAVYNTTLVLWIALTLARGQAFAPLAVSGVLAAQSIPLLLIRRIAGVFIDRWDKRRTMIVMDVLRAIIIGSLLPATGIVPLPFVAGGRLPLLGQLGAVYAVVFLATICAQFFNPAQLALIGDIVADLYLGRAFGLDYVTENVALIAGPPLAALLSVALAGWLDSSVLRGLHVVLGPFTFGPVDTIYAAVGGIAVLAGLYALRNLGAITRAPE